MSKASLVLSCLIALWLCACKTSAVQEDVPAQAAELIEDAGRDIDNQRFDAAMDKSLSALVISRREGSALGEVRSLMSIVGADIMTSRDDDAWEKALEAEAIAREHGFAKELSGILISKAKLCSYAEISPETGRNDEGLAYAEEALALAEDLGAVEEQAEACYVTGSLYINKNRWSDPINPGIYNTAGQWLDRGQALADTYDLLRLKRNGILFRSRWFQQGGRNDEAIRYFEQVLKSLKESDYLTAAALDDRLVRLYTRVGESGKALDAHDDYVFRMQKYIRQKQDETLQEMETRFEVQDKDRRIELGRYQTAVLLLALLLVAAAVVFVCGRLRAARRRTSELQRLNDSKEQIIEFLSRDLKNPANVIAGKIAQLSVDAASLAPEKIREKCKALATEAEAMNTDIADYVGDVLVERSKKIADIGLSPREIQIIRLSAEGLKASEIAERTFLSVHTVNTHRQRIYSKMGVKNVSDMIRKATELGII